MKSQITFTQAVENAAKSDELAKVLYRTLQAFNDKQQALEKVQEASDYMRAEAIFVAQCEANIQAIDMILNRSANELAGRRLCLAS